MINPKKVLLFHVNKEKSSQISNLCKELGLQVITVEKKQYNESLGALAGIQGFSPAHKSYSDAEFPMEMMVFSGFPSKELDSFLAFWHTRGIAPIPLKAILTPHNVFWTARELYGELMKEHLQFTACHDTPAPNPPQDMHR